MKKIYYIYLLSGLFFVTILSTSTLSQGWSNGQNMVGAVNPINEPIYIQLYHTDYDTYIPGTRNTYYGTHDWIAESVLELLYLYNPGNSFITSLKNNEDYMKMYYLVGTEYPDMQPRYNFELVTRCGFVIELTSSSEAPSSKIRWDSISGIPTIDYLGTGVQLMYQQIQQAFLARDCQRAAFYLGALMHYIGDASYYGHMIDGVEWRVIYQHISYITEKLWYARTSTDFFLTDEAKARLTAFSNPTQFLIQPQALLGH